MQGQEKRAFQDAAPTIGAFIWELIRDLDNFFFGKSKPSTLGLIRLLAGLAIFYIHFCYSFDLLSFVGPDAWMDDKLVSSLREKDLFFYPSDTWNGNGTVVEGKQSTFSVFFHIQDPTGIWVVHLSFLAVNLMFALGLWTRTTSVLTWIATLSYVQRSPYSLFGMDTISTVLVFYLMLSPCDKAFALDSLFERLRKRRAGDPNWDAPPEETSWATFISRFMQIHFCIIYLAAGTSKLLGSSWWNGTALWFVYGNNEFTPMDNPLYFQTLVYLVNHRILWEIVMTSCAVYTLLLELALPFLIWYPRWKWVMMAGSYMLHLGIGVFMGLKLFSILMILLVSSFLPPEVAEWIRVNWARSLGLVRTPSPIVVKRSAVA